MTMTTFDRLPASAIFRFPASARGTVYMKVDPQAELHRLLEDIFFNTPDSDDHDHFDLALHCIYVHLGTGQLFARRRNVDVEYLGQPAGRIRVTEVGSERPALQVARLERAARRPTRESQSTAGEQIDWFSIQGGND